MLVVEVFCLFIVLAPFLFGPLLFLIILFLQQHQHEGSSPIFLGVNILPTLEDWPSQADTFV
jgi:hypothetical protein